MKLLDEKWAISPRDEDAPPWQDVQDKDWEAMKMAVYAAQVDRMDQGVARLLATLRALGQEENTLMIFLSDNGGYSQDRQRSRASCQRRHQKILYRA